MEDRLYGVGKTEVSGEEKIVDEGPYTLQKAKSLALEYNGEDQSGALYEARMSVDISGE